MKTRRLTKKEHDSILKSMNITKIHKLISMANLDANDKMTVYNYIVFYAPTKKVRDMACALSFCRADNKVLKHVAEPYMPIKKIIYYMKRQIAEKWNRGDCFEIKMEDEDYIYYSQPINKHSEFNIAVKLENTEKNKKLLKLIGSIINKYKDKKINFNYFNNYNADNVIIRKRTTLGEQYLFLQEAKKQSPSAFFRSKNGLFDEKLAATKKINFGRKFKIEK